MAPRITMITTPNGEFELLLNEQGRDLLVRELTSLSERSEHFHLRTFEGAEVEMGARAYRPTDVVIHAAKVLLRPDARDRLHFPHVIADTRR